MPVQYSLARIVSGELLSHSEQRFSNGCQSGLTLMVHLSRCETEDAQCCALFTEISPNDYEFIPPQIHWFCVTSPLPIIQE